MESGVQEVRGEEGSGKLRLGRLDSPSYEKGERETRHTGDLGALRDGRLDVTNLIILGVTLPEAYSAPAKH